MMGKVFNFLFFALIILNSCFKSEEQNKNAYTSVEKFVDSLNIAEKGKIKVEIENFRNNDKENNLIIVNFYKQDSIWNYKKQKNVGNIWRRIDRFYFDKDGVTGIDAEILDFNNDGFKDITYQSGIAARGGNVIKTLFIYQPKEKRFIHVKNSDSFPNIFYNHNLNCINSFVFTGSTTTVFTKLENDSLKEFASVDFAKKITIYKNGIDGKSKMINEISTVGYDAFIPFKNYNPLVQYKKEEFKNKF